MQLVFVAHGRCATFEITDVAAFVRNDERALKLPGIGGVDAEVGRQLHRAANALGDVDERTITEDGRVQRGKIIVASRHYRTEVLPDELGMLDNGF